MNDHFERLLIIADDLTGALDTAAPFAAAGHKVTVVADHRYIEDALDSDADVITVTTRSREVEPAEAASRVATVTAELPPGMRLFKKVDSRLKGNLEAELSAIGFERAAVLPGIPEFGRTVKDGHIQGFGVEQPIPIAERLGTLTHRCRFPDTLTVDDMQIAASAIERGELLVGALSLAKAIAGDTLPSPITYPARQILIAIGSRDPITLKQVAALRAARPDLSYIPAPNGRVDTARYSHSNASITLIQAVPCEAEASPAHVAKALSSSVASLGHAGETILLSGGATAEAYFDDRGIHTLDFLGEALPGLPVAEFGGTFYITKSGGFGAEETLLNLAETVTGGVA